MTTMADSSDVRLACRTGTGHRRFKVELVEVDQLEESLNEWLDDGWCVARMDLSQLQGFYVVVLYNPGEGRTVLLGNGLL